MATPDQIRKAALIVGLMYRQELILKKALDILTEKLGEIEDSLEYDFTFTDYYENETGKGLKKRIVVFKYKIDRETLPDIKIWTNELETRFSKDEKRQINIDPGYMTEQNVVLASAKELPHRPLLGKGIFGDVVLVYKAGTFTPHPRTFPDYKSEKVIQFFNRIRKQK